MTILDTIVAKKRQEVAQNKDASPTSGLEKSSLFDRTTISMSKGIRKDPHGIIAEFKRKSPSEKGIQLSASPKEVVHGYTSAGAAALSVLTDQAFFGGGSKDLIDARMASPLPMIRKDFIVDPYQIVEAKSIGADAILLIASCLSKEAMLSLTREAHALGLEVLCEVHDPREIEKVPLEADMIGVNNRDLKTFTTRIEHSMELQDFLPSEMVQISESGIRKPEDVSLLKQAGFDGFLIGTLFMKQPDPASSCRAFIEQLNTLVS